MTAIIVQSLGQKILFSNRTCVSQIVLVGHQGNCGSDVPAPGWPHSWPLPWMSSFWFNWKLEGRVRTLVASDKVQTRAWWEGGWGVPDANPQCLWPSRLLLLPKFLGIVLGTVHFQVVAEPTAWGSAGFLVLPPKFQCSSGSTRSSGVGWPGGVCWPRRVGGVQWKALEQWI